jgi:hypothetical protein
MSLAIGWTSYFLSKKLDWTIKVVCERCNNTWMGEIESKYAKPVMTPLILGRAGIAITQSDADAIGRFAFKTAVILDHLARARPPFFSRFARHEFRKCHAIPASVRMWLAGFASLERGNAKTIYHEGEDSTGNRFQFYICTYSVGHLAFQVVSLRNPLPRMSFSPADDRFELLTIPYWPWIPSGTLWPPAHVLGSVAEFDAFADRWHRVSVRSLSE